MKLSFPTRLDPMLLEGQPELSYALVGLSLLLPYVEPYLIRTMSKARRVVSDPQLRESISLFNGQEGQHSRLHTRFNEAVRESCPALESLEEELARDYRRFTTTRSLQWNLAYAEGFEAFTAALATFLLEEQTLRNADPAVRDLFEWHIVEELEHRCVAFDVYNDVSGSYAYRLSVGMFAQQHLTRFVLRVARAMLERDRKNGRTHGGKAQALARLAPFLARMALRLLPQVLKTYSPRYTPHGLGMPDSAKRVLQRLEKTAEAQRARSTLASPPAREMTEAVEVEVPQGQELRAAG